MVRTIGTQAIKAAKKANPVVNLRPNLSPIKLPITSFENDNLHIGLSLLLQIYEFYFFPENMLKKLLKSKF